MTLFTTKLAAALFALILVGLPIPGESGGFETAMSGADVEDQSFVPGGRHYLYDVEEIDLASGPSAEFAGKGESFEWHRIRFLEENFWDHDIIAQPEGDVDETGTGVYAIDPDAFSEEILWQDRFEDVATFAQAEAENLFPEANDVPQFHAGELNY